MLLYVQVHFISREMVDLAKFMLKHFQLSLVDSLLVMLSKLVYGDLTKYVKKITTQYSL